MLQSKFIYKTYKEEPGDEESRNAKLLIRAGFVEKVSSGIYNFLPLGLRVIDKIENIIREELNKIGCQELLLTNLHPKEYWERTGRWEKFDVLFKTKSQTGSEYSLAPTHEEIIFPLVKKLINSYKNLPLALYQIHTKYRDEFRAKSGLLRNKEFIMKDLYSFHHNNEEVEKFKKIVDKTYMKIFKRCGLRAIETFASGGTFSAYSTEFQIPTPAGEDIIYYCQNCKIAWNKEIFKLRKCKQCKKELEELKAIEVGNTFNLGTKFSEAFEVKYIDKDNKEKLVCAGCYGIGVTRLMGAIVEVYNDKKGIIWPDEVAPFLVHLLIIYLKDKNKNKKLKRVGFEVYEKLKRENIEVLVDEREDVSSGEKLVESDLMGIPYKIVIGENYLKYRKFDFRKRNWDYYNQMDLNQIIKFLH